MPFSTNKSSPSLENSDVDAKIEEALATRAPAGVFSYLFLFAGLAWATGAFVRFPFSAPAVSGWMISLGLARLYLARQHELRLQRRPTWSALFQTTTLLAGLSWGVCCAVSTHVSGWNADSVVVLVTTAGMAAGAIISLSPSLRLVRAYIAGMLAPSIVSVLSSGRITKLEITFAIILSLYVAFLSAQAGHLHRAFVVAIEHARLLELRATALADRTASMRLVLDSVGQGYLRVESDGSMGAERSAILEKWFGPVSESERAWSYLGRSTSLSSAWFELAWEQLTMSELPVAVALAQLPTTIATKDRTFALEYRPLDGSSAYLFIVTDVTSDVEGARHDEERREALAVFEQVQTDRAGFFAFMKEAERLLADLTTAPAIDHLPEYRRWLHTLKGTSSMFGLLRFSRRCHELEDELADAGALSSAQIASLTAAWNESVSPLKAVIGDARGTIEILEAERIALREALLAGASVTDLISQIDAWLLEPAAANLHRLGHQAGELAKRLGKQVDIEIQADDIRLPQASLGPIWASLVHVIRNAVDHGVESAERRVAAGKSARGSLRLSASVEANDLVLVIRDDGAGVDWEAVRERACGLGLPGASKSDLHAALFSDGLTTGSELTEISGRGVGLPALAAAVKAARGSVSVMSGPEGGTACVVRIPLGSIFQDDSLRSHLAARSPRSPRSLRHVMTAAAAE